MTARPELEALAASKYPLTSRKCEALARAAAESIDLERLERTGAGKAELLWRSEHSEGWLNTWWEPRDTGFHDHDGSYVGVYVLEGEATHEPLSLGGPRQIQNHRSGETFSLERTGIHRVEHERGAVTLHVYAPPLRSLGHYELVEGQLRRTSLSADEVTPASPALLEALGS